MPLVHVSIMVLGVMKPMNVNVKMTTQGISVRNVSTISYLLPPANEVWGKVIFLHLFVILFTGGVCHSACWNTTPLSRRPPTKETPLPRRPPYQGNPPGQGDPPWQGDPSNAEHAGRYGQRGRYESLLECNLVILECF